MRRISIILACALPALLAACPLALHDDFQIVSDGGGADAVRPEGGDATLAGDTNRQDGTSAADTGVPDANVPDTSVPDTSAIDTGAADAGTIDTGVADAGRVDTGVPDTSVVDTGVADTSIGDTSVTVLTDAGASCTSCVATAEDAGGQCYSDLTACMNDTSCATLVSCLNACAPTNQTCVNNCGGAASQSAITEYNNLGNCICTTACKTPCSDSGC